MMTKEVRIGYDLSEVSLKVKVVRGLLRVKFQWLLEVDQFRLLIKSTEANDPDSCRTLSMNDRRIFL